MWLVRDPSKMRDVVSFVELEKSLTKSGMMWEAFVKTWAGARVKLEHGVIFLKNHSREMLSSKFG